jgi:dienelactone hydrolase
MEEWSIRGLLNPVIARLLIYGVNPNDVEYVLSNVETRKLINARLLERSWLEEWEQKAARYLAYGEEAVKKNNDVSAREFFFLAAQCYYAIFLINLKEITDKQRIYQRYADLYRRSIVYYKPPVEYVEIPLADNHTLPGYLHHGSPSSTGKNPCAIIFSGLGSCKEEMHMLARPLVERGISVLIPDMPGNGEALFMHKIQCNIRNLSTAFTRVVDYLETRADIKKEAIGSYGLCMGGGYAYRAAAVDSRYSFCVTLFPLLITKVEPGSTPQWMKQGEWVNFQTGGIPAADFMEEMRLLEEGKPQCPYFFIHGEHDNWMTLASAMQFFDKAQGEKERLIIAEQPVFFGRQAVTHAMPVGEQLHWVRHVVGDWIALKCKG